MTIENSTVYGVFYRGEQPITGSVTFIPRDWFVTIDGAVYLLTILDCDIVDGILTHNGTPGISIPASTSGILWDVRAVPMGYSNMIQSYPGDIISLGD